MKSLDVINDYQNFYTFTRRNDDILNKTGNVAHSDRYAAEGVVASASERAQSWQHEQETCDDGAHGVAGQSEHVS